MVAYGEPFYGIGIIAGGKVALTKEMYSGNRIIMGILDEGDIFGETGSLYRPSDLADDRDSSGR